MSKKRIPLKTIRKAKKKKEQRKREKETKERIVEYIGSEKEDKKLEQIRFKEKE